MWQREDTCAALLNQPSPLRASAASPLNHTQTSSVTLRGTMRKFKQNLKQSRLCGANLLFDNRAQTTPTEGIQHCNTHTSNLLEQGSTTTLSQVIKRVQKKLLLLTVTVNIINDLRNIICSTVILAV